MYFGDEVDIAIRQYEADLQREKEVKFVKKLTKKVAKKPKERTKSYDITDLDIRNTKKRHEEISKLQLKEFAEKYK